MYENLIAGAVIVASLASTSLAVGSTALFILGGIFVLVGCFILLKPNSRDRP